MKAVAMQQHTMAHVLVCYRYGSVTVVSTPLVSTLIDHLAIRRLLLDEDGGLVAFATAYSNEFNHVAYVHISWQVVVYLSCLSYSCLGGSGMMPGHIISHMLGSVHMADSC